MQALHSLGVANPAQNFIVASQGAFDEDGIPVVVLAKKTPFAEEEEAAVEAHFDRYEDFNPLYLPSEPGQNAFSDMIAAITFVRDLGTPDGVKLSVLDPLGRITFETEL